MKLRPVTIILPNRTPLFLMLCLHVLGVAHGQTPALPTATQLPTAGRVVAGQAQIQQNNAVMSVIQATNRAAIEWGTFNVGSSARVDFVQPSASSVTLNRVLSSDASQIMGKITSNGQVFLSNPNGVIFGPKSQVDVGGLTATTLNMSNQNFMAGNNQWESSKSGGTVLNQGQLTAYLGGYIALLAPQVINEGVIWAREGTVALAAGDKVSLQIGGNKLISLQIDKSALDVLIENRQAVRAEGGLILISANSANALRETVIKNTGSLSAPTLSQVGGRIMLDAGPRGSADLSGQIAAKGETNATAGGSVVATGEHLVLRSNLVIDASGQTSGGSVLVGGGWQGSGSTRQATTVTMESGSAIDVSSKGAGSGGMAVLWSQVSNPDSQTLVRGSIDASAGPQGGNGGKVETSGRRIDITQARVTAAAPQGKAGTWLIDPTDLTIDAATASTISTALSAGSSVESQADRDITLDTNVSITKNAGADTTLTISAGRDITLNAGSSIQSSSGKLDTVLRAGYTAGSPLSAGVVTLNSNASIASNGGAVQISGTRFTNNSGSNALDTGSGGSWQVWSRNTDPFNASAAIGDTTGGLAFDYKQYNATLGTTAPLGTGNAFLYSYAPVLTVSLAGSASKVYDGTTTAALGASNFSTIGAVGGDTGINLTLPSTGTYASKNVGASVQVTASNLALQGVTSSAATGGKPVYGYTLSSSSINGAIGEITPKTVSLSASKTYDGTTALSAAQVTIQTNIANESLTAASATASDAHVATSGNYVQSISLANGTGGAASNYQLPALNNANAPVTITPATLTPTLTNTGVTKAYDGTTNAPTGFTPTYSFSGLVSGDTAATLGQTSIALNNAHVGQANTLTVSGLSLSGITGNKNSAASDYTLSTSTQSVAATVTPKTLTATASIGGTLTKTYDGTTAATGANVTGSVSGAVAGDTLSLNTSGITLAYNNAHVVGANAIVASGTGTLTIGSSTANSVAGDYSFTAPTIANAAANITAKALTTTAAIGGTLNKTYDGTTAATGATITSSVSGAVGDDALTLNTSGITLAYNSAHVGTANKIVATGSGTLAINSPTAQSVLTDYSFTAPTLADATAYITPKALTSTATIGGTLTKTYDGTTAATGATLTGSVSGAVSGDTLSLNTSGITLAYNNAHVGSATRIVATGSGTLTIASTGSNSVAGDYSFSAPSITDATATITPKALTATASIGGTLTKTYDGTTAATGANVTGSVSGAVAGDTLSLNTSGISLAYNNAHAGTATQITATGNGTLTIGASSVNSVAGDYSFTAPTIANANATITPKALTATASIGGTLSKVYDGTTNATGANVSGTVSGAIAGDTLSLNTSAITLAYNNAHVAGANAVVASGSSTLTINSATASSVAGDYSFTAPTIANATASITPATLTPTLTNTGVTKTYDGTTAAPSGFTPTYSVAGLVSGDTAVSLNNTSSAFNNAHVAQANKVTVGGLSVLTVTGNRSSVAGDYQLDRTSLDVAATITAKSLTSTATIGGTLTKTYDGTTAATGATLSSSVTGAVVGDTLSLNTSGIALAYNNAHVGAANKITATGSGTLTIGASTASSVASDYSFTAPTITDVTASITPKALTATASIGGTLTKAYDGTTAATGASVAGSVTGGIAGDSLSLNTSGITLAYNNAHVVGATAIVASGTSTLTISSPTASSVAGDYTFTAPAIAAATATITPKALTSTASIGGTLTKAYDGTTTATGATVSGSVSGAVSGDTLSLNTTGVTLAYNQAHVANATAIVASGSTALTIASTTANSVASDYSFSAPTIADATATITPKALTATASIGGTLTKTYDGTTAATGATLSGSVSGAVSGDTLSLNTSGITLAYNNAHVALANKVVASGSGTLTIASTGNNSVAGDYSFTAPTIADATASITAKALTASASIGGTLTKTYDGTTAATGATVSGSVTGAITGDTLSLNTSGITLAYNSAHVGTANKVVATGTGALTVGTSSSSSVASDYSFTSPSITDATASITPKALTTTASIGGTLTKVYDGTTAATGATVSGSVTGAITGDSLSLNTSGITLAYNSAHAASATAVVASGSGTLTIGTSSASSVAGDYSFTAPTIANAAATITPKALTATASIGGTLTKTYDGTTAATGATVSGTVTGAVADDTLSLSTAGVTLAYNTAHVATANKVVATGSGTLAINSPTLGSLASDYSFSAPVIADATASITAKALTATASIGGTLTKTYDGTTTATGATVSGSVTGAISGDTLSLNTAGITLSYNNAHVASANKVVASGSGSLTIASTGSNSVVSDYSFTAPTVADANATITARALTTTASIGGTLTKAYDGTTTATGASVSGTVSGGIAGDTLTLNTSGVTLAYNNAHVANANAIVATGSSTLTITSPTAGSLAGDYSFTAPTIAAATAAITPKALTSTASIGGTLTKAYDGTTAATGATVSGSVSGAVSGDTLSLNTSGVTLAYNNSHVASASKVVATGNSTLSIDSSSNSSVAGDYSFTAPTIADATASITPKALTATASIGGTLTKTYDGTTTATGATVSGTITGAVSGDTLNLNTSGITLAYNNAHVAGATAVVASGNSTLTIASTGNNSVAGDYSFTAPTIANATASITPKALTTTASIGGTLTKTYDGTTTATGATIAGTVSGGIAGDTLSLDTSGIALAYNSAHVATANKVTATGSGTLAISVSAANSAVSDYSFTAPSVADATASITPKALTATASIGGTLTKVYDGTTTATGASVSGSVTGAITGDSLSLNTSGVTLAYNNAHVVSATSVVASGTSTLTIISPSASSVATDYSFTAPTLANAAASITPKALTSTASIGGTLTKTYDGTTAATGATLAGSVSGGIAGDTLSLNTTGITLAYNDAHVATANKVVASGSSSLSIGATTSNSVASDYSFTAPVIADAAAAITAKALTATASIGGTLTKIYDGTTAATGATVSGSVTGAISGDTLSLNTSGIALSYNNAHVASANKVVASGSGTLTIGASGSNSVASDYSFTAPTIADANATITTRALSATASIRGTLTKTYDGTTAATGATVSGSITGGIAGDTLNLNTSGITLAYNDAHVVGANKVTASGNGTLLIASTNSNSAASDYSFTAPTVADATASITPKALTSTASIGGTLTKTYDGTTAATGATVTGNVAGAINGDTLTLNTTGVTLAYNNAHVANANAIVASGSGTLAISSPTANSVASDYTFTAPTIADASASITPKALTSAATIGGTLTKVYDGTTATGATVSGTVTGALAADTLSLNTSGITLAYNNAHVVGANAVVASGSGSLVINASTVNSVASDYSFTSPTIANAVATITPKALTSTASIGGTLTKVYDGTTTATGASVSGSVSGAISGDTLSLNTAGVTLAYNDAHVASANKITASGNGSLTIAATGSNSVASDYSFTAPVIADALGATITTRALTATANIGGVLSKTYDGTVAATGATVTGSITGGIAGDSLNLNTSGITLAYNTAHVATANRIAVTTGSAALAIGASASNSVAGDYSFTPPTIAAATASITPKALTATASIGGTLTKTYDGTTSTGATLTGSVTGGISADTLTLNTSGITLAYNDAHVATANAVVASGTSTLTISSPTASSLASDYTFTAPTIANAAAVITPKALTATASIGGTLTKVYDGTTTATGATVSGTVTGGLNNDTLSLNTAGVSLAYNSAHVAGANAVVASGQGTLVIGASAANSVATDYSFTAPTIANAAASITPKALTSTASIGGTLTKTYDGTTAATGATVTGTVSGAIAGDTLNLNTSGIALSYNNAHVASANTISATGSGTLNIASSASSSAASDYTFSAPVIADATSARITPRTLTASAVIGGTLSKVYDGTTAATGATLSSAITGGIAGDSLSLNTSAITLAYNNAHVVGATAVVASGTSSLTITSPTANSVAGDYTFTAPTIAAATASITPKALTSTASIGGTLTKVYDGTTTTGATVAGTVTGAIGGDTLSLNTSGVSLAYNTAHVATANAVVAAGASTLTISSPTANSVASDYSFTAPTIADAAAVITPKALTSTASIGGTLTKTYDGTTAATGATVTGTVSGGITGDTLNLNTSGITLSYNNAHVVGATAVVASGSGALGIGASSANSLVSDYSFTAPTITSAAATITPKALTSTASIGGALTKTYDGTTAATGAAVTSSITGAVAGDTLSLNTSGITLAYDNAHVALATRIAATGSGTLSINSAQAASVSTDYSFTAPTLADAAATITPRVLSAAATIGGTLTKVYDGTTSATGANVSGAVTGGIAGDSLSLNLSQISLAYNSAHVATANAVVASGTSALTISSPTANSLASDYVFTAPTISNAIATITPKALTAAASIGGTLTKTYDGTTAATGATVSGTVTGGINGDTLGLDTSGVSLAYNNAHVASARRVTATGSGALTISSPTYSSVASDYSFTAPVIADATAAITPKALTTTASIGGTLTKTYDGTTAATGASVVSSVSGAVSGDTLGLNSAGITLAYDNAHVALATKISATGSGTLAIASSASNSVAGDYSFTAPTIADVNGTITAKALTATASIGGTLTKTYDGTTAATGANVSGSVSGAVAGDTLSLNTSGVSLAYNNAHVGSASAIVASGTSTLTINSPVNTSVASDYTFVSPVIADVAATITPKALTTTATIGGSLTKTYDGTTSATGASIVSAITGGIAGDSLSLNTAGVTLAYNSAHVLTATTISASGNGALNINSSAANSVAGDYSFTAPTIANANATVTAKPLTTTASIGGTLSKVYDGTTAATGATVSGSVTGAIAGDTLGLNTSGISLAYNSAHAASASKVIASGSGTLTISSPTSNSAASDYSFSAPQIADATAVITPRVLTTTASIGGALTKAYDGTTAATGATISSSITGGIAGDTLSLDTSNLSLAYNNAHVVGASSIVASGSSALTIVSPTASSIASDYSFTAPTIANASATITPKAIITTAAIGGTLTKTYDGTTAATGATVTSAVTGAIAGDTLSLNTSGITLAYNSAHVVGANAILASGSSSLSISSPITGSVVSDYNFIAPTIASTAASITPKLLTSTASIGGTLTKAYDGTAAATGATATGTVTGAVAGDTLSLNTSPVNLAYNSSHAGDATAIVATGNSTLTISSPTARSVASDYDFTAPTIANAAGSITPKVLTTTASIGGTLTKTYDGTTVATGAAIVSNIAGAAVGDTLSLNTSGITLAYNNAHVAAANRVTATGSSALTIASSGNGSVASDYAFTAPVIADAAATITPKALASTANIGGTLTKTYDGTAAATGATISSVITGAVAGDTLSLNTSGITLAYNTAHVATATKITASGSSALSINSSTANSAVSDYSFTAPTLAEVAATITPKALTTAASIGGTLTKTYDGTTAATGAAVSSSVTGGIVGDTLSLDTTGVTLAYNTAHVATANAIVATGASSLAISSPTANSVPSDYSFTLPTIANAVASITPRALTATASIGGTLTKTYDGTTAAPSAALTGSIAGAIAGDTVNLDSTGINLAYNNAHVVGASSISATGSGSFTIANTSNSSVNSDYSYTAPVISNVAGSITPRPLTVTGSIGGTLTKTYDGNAVATGALVAGNVAGGIASDSLSLNSAGINLNYNSAHVASANRISASGSGSLTINSPTASSVVSDYSFTTPVIADVTASITPKLLTATASIGGSLSKIYDGSTTATGATIGSSVSGAVAGDSLSLDTTGVSLNYNSAHVVTANTIVASGPRTLAIISPSAGSEASDYNFTAPTIANAAATITPKALTVTASIGGTLSKTYDGTTASAATVTGVVTGAIASDTVSLDTTGMNVRYNSAHVATATTLSASGASALAISSPNAGSLASDYSFTTPTISTAAGTITPRALTSTASIGGTLTKTYDGTTSAPGAVVAGSVSGGVNGDTLSLDTSGITLAYNNAHVALARKVTASGSGALTIAASSSNSVAGDYSFTPPVIADVNASISAKALTATASIGGTLTKVYDGTTAATGATVNGTVDGAVAGDTLSLNTSNVLLSYNSPRVVGANAIVASGNSTLSISSPTASSLASDYSFTAPTIANASASITPKALTSAATIGGTLNKTYDGNTAATGATLAGNVQGAISGDSVTLDVSNLSLNYNSTHVSTATAVNASGTSGFIIGNSPAGSVRSDYSFSQPVISDAAAFITPKVLTATATIVGNPTKVYDGNAVAKNATLSSSVSGAIAGDALSLNTGTITLNYNSSHVAQASTISATGSASLTIGASNAGSETGDYQYTSPVIASVAGNITPKAITATAAIGGTLTKVYDGGTSASGANLTGAVQGAVTGDTLSLDTTAATLSYDSAHVATATAINAAGTLGFSVSNSNNASVPSDYRFTAPSVPSATASITPATLTPQLTNTGVTKTYDGTTAAPTGFTPTFSFSGLVNGDTAAVLTSTSAVYDSTHAGQATKVVVSGLGLSSISGSNASAVSDYTLSTTTREAAATITQKVLTATANIGGTLTKTYDGTTEASGASVSGSIAGGVTGDTLKLNTSGITLAYNTAHVATANKVMASGNGTLTIESSTRNSLPSDYSFTAPVVADVAASITPRNLTSTATIGGVLTKTYDGSTTAPVGATVSGEVAGGVSGDTLSLITSGVSLAYNSARVTAANAVAASGNSTFRIDSSGSASQPSDYTLTQPTIASVEARITKKMLTSAASIGGTLTKTYDGTTEAPGATVGGSVSGAIAGDTLNLDTSQVTLAYNSAHVSSATAVVASGSSALAIGATSNGSLSSDYTLTQPNIAGATANITARTLTATASIGGATTKTYDGTTVATGATAVGSVAGAIAGDNISLNVTNVRLNYDNAHVNNASTILASGTTTFQIDGTTASSQTTDYRMNQPVIANVVGNITPAALNATARIGGVLTKTYDGTTVAPTGATVTGEVTGAASGDTLTLDTSGVTLAYNNAHVANATALLATGSPVLNIAAGPAGSVASDYSFTAPTVSNATARITPATLVATVTNTGVTKTYDGTTAIPSGFTPTFAVTGFVPGDTAATVNHSDKQYNNAHVGLGNKVIVSGLTLGAISGNKGSVASDYALDASSKDVTASITPATLSATASIGGTLTKTYDGTTTASGASVSGTVTGAVAGDNLTLSMAGISLNYNSAHVNTAQVPGATSIAATGSPALAIASSVGSLPTDYSYTAPAVATVSSGVSITPKAVTSTASISGATSKTYDGTTTASGASVSGYIAGALTGDTLNLDTSRVALNYNSPHVNTTQVAGATAIAASGNSSILVGSSSWGSLASDYSLTQPSILNAPASITPRMGIPMATISGSVTKMYDGTTSAPGATLSGTVNNAITGDTFSFDISSLTFSYAFSQSGVNSVRVAVPANYLPTLTANSVSKQTDYTLQPFTIAPATGYIIPVVTVSIPSIAPAITVAAPASTASSGNASTGGGAGGNNASKGDGSSSSGSGSSGSNNSADPAGDNSQ